MSNSRDEVEESDSTGGNDSLGLEESWGGERELGELPLPEDEDGEENNSKLPNEERSQTTRAGSRVRDDLCLQQS